MKRIFTAVFQEAFSKGASAPMLKSRWQADAGHLICTWSEAEMQVPYNPPWMEDTSKVVSQDDTISVSPELDFKKVSLLGGSRWLQRGLQSLTVCWRAVTGRKPVMQE
jgi:hypothetical protein